MNLGEWPLDVNRRKIGHVGGDQRRFGMALAMADRGPRQIIGILAFDQVGPESLERRREPRRCAASAGNAGFRERAATRS